MFFGLLWGVPALLAMTVAFGICYRPHGGGGTGDWTLFVFPIVASIPCLAVGALAGLILRFRLSRVGLGLTALAAATGHAIALFSNAPG